MLVKEEEKLWFVGRLQTALHEPALQADWCAGEGGGKKRSLRADDKPLSPGQHWEGVAATGVRDVVGGEKGADAGVDSYR